MKQEQIRAASHWLLDEDPAGRLARRSLDALLGHEYVNEALGIASIRLRLEDPQAFGRAVSVSDASRLLVGFQRGVARIVKARLKASADVSRLSTRDLEYARLDVVNAYPGSLNLVLEPHGSSLLATADDALDVAPGSRVGAAADSLIRSLPADGNDSATVDGIAAAEPVLRHAVLDVARATGGKVSAQFEMGVRESDLIRASLTKEQSASISEILSAPVVSQYKLTRKGFLDGIRTSRRVFYLVLDSGEEIHGVIGDQTLESARTYLGGTVLAQLRVVETRSKGGGKTNRSFALEGLDLISELPFS